MYKYMCIPCIYNNMYIIYHLFVSSLCFCLCISFPPSLSFLSPPSLSLFLSPLLSFTLSLLSSFLLAWPQHYFLRGHKRRVTSLLYPCDYSSAYDNYLVVLISLLDCGTSTKEYYYTLLLFMVGLSVVL